MKITTVLLISLVFLAGCQTAPSSKEDRQALHADVNAAIAAFKRKDPSIDQHFDNAVGYAVFPSVGKGGMGVGGAYGRGELYEKGTKVGHCDLSQATIGFQLGGQVYRELIFFQTAQSLTSFKRGEFEVAAQASAVAVEAGASETADYENGVLIFTLVDGGLMYEATVGGQKFSFEPISN